MAKLLRELNEDVQLIVENVNNSKKYVIEGIFLQSEVVNRNRRKYPKDVLDEEVNNYIKSHVQKNIAYGELGHPKDEPGINLDRVSHLITELRCEGNNWYGKALVADNDKGNIIKSLYEIGGKLGVSSRALGSLRDESGVNVVQNDLKIMTAADVVADPSAPGAYVDMVMEEKEWILTEDGKWIGVFLDHQNIIKRASKRELEEKSLEIFRDFLSKI